MAQHLDHETPWLHRHAHDPNPTPPPGDPDFVVVHPDGGHITVTVADLRAQPAFSVPDCYIVSTGHGASGPFTFTGVRLYDLLESLLGSTTPWGGVDVVSADEFGARILRDELRARTNKPILLSYAIDGAAMTRAQGLVRLIVPGETKDALRQVKWVAHIYTHETS
jgi:DMSO/TMAO reductase YedYZ molybdopterin-dependent catalytic subunit